MDSLIFAAKCDDVFTKGPTEVWVAKCSDKVGITGPPLSLFVQQETEGFARTITISHVVTCLTF